MEDDDDDITVVASNVTRQSTKSDDATASTASMSDDDDEGHTSLPYYPTYATTYQTSRPANKKLTPAKQSPFHLQPATPMATRRSAWTQIVQANNLQQLPRSATIFNPQRLARAVKHAISDSGATGHFLAEGAPVINKRIADHPITITLPNGKVIQSTHTCNLDIPWLPAQITEAHIVPGLAHASLISTRKFCNAGCKVVFDMSECRVYHNRKMVWVGD